MEYVKKIFILAIFALMPFVVFSQSYPVNLRAEAIKNYDEIKKGSVINIDSIVLNMTSPNIDQALYESHYSFKYSGSVKRIRVYDNIGKKLVFKPNSIQDFWDAQIISKVLGEVNKKGLQYELRAEMESDALDFINRAKTYGLELEDPYLENYIYTLISKIAPKILIDGRPGNINLLILKDPSQNACIFPNGTLVVNTGLLSYLHSEDELVAILCHEIAHFILDHSVKNVNKAIARKKRAEFWAAVATGITAVAEGVVAANNNYYVPGGATLGMAMLSSSIANEVVDRLGMNYNHEQEYEADEVAVKALEFLKYDTNALATALNRMKECMHKERINASYFASYSHPALIERIYKSGIPQRTNNSQYNKIVSFAVTNTAHYKYESKRFREVIELVSQNIEHNVATDDDYMLKAHCLLKLDNTPESNIEVLSLIEKAKAINPSNINIYKAEILAYLRQDKNAEAITLLSDYVGKLNQMKIALSDIQSGSSWESAKQFIDAEKSWASNMIIKVKGL